MDWSSLLRFRENGQTPEEPQLPILSIEEKVDQILLALHVPMPDEANRFSSEVQYYLDRGQKINAITVYRDETGCDLKEAKDAIDAGEPHSPASRVLTKLDHILESLGVPQPQEPGTAQAMNRGEASTVSPASATLEIEQLVRDGRLLEAIRRYRLHTRCGLKEAKDAVDAIVLRQKER